LAAIVDEAMDRWFSDKFQTNSPDVVDRIRSSYLATSLQGFVGCLHALSQADFRADIGNITVPTLVVAGKNDPVCEISELQKMADTLKQGSLVVIEGRHICNLESAPAFNDALLAFFGT
jgi:3-oxoadipate enol-lactonase